MLTLMMTFGSVFGWALVSVFIIATTILLVVLVNDAVMVARTWRVWSYIPQLHWRKWLRRLGIRLPKRRPQPPGSTW